MQCVSCSAKAVFPSLCEEHFLAFVEDKVKQTIAEFNLCSPDESVCVAASGGKDSTVLLFILKKLGFRVEALAVDEGISGYRDRSLEDLKAFCDEQNISLRVVSFADEVGKPLDDMVQGRYPCSVCGVFRRYVLNKHAKEYDVIATGHNLDDEAQAALMNLLKANTDLLSRSFVRTPPVKGFVPRIKPLLFLSEREIAAYSLLKGFPVHYAECPHVHKSLRAQVRDDLNAYEYDNPGMKLSLVNASLRIGRGGEQSLHACDECGEPSAHAVCRACSLKHEVIS